MKTLIFKVLYLLKMCAIFVGSVHNFGKSDKYLFPIDALMVLMPNLIKKSWTVSSPLTMPQNLTPTYGMVLLSQYGVMTHFVGREVNAPRDYFQVTLYICPHSLRRLI